jgi:hypothetical protein
MQDFDSARSYFCGKRDEVGLCSRGSVSVTVLRCKQLHAEPVLSPIAKPTRISFQLASVSRASACVRVHVRVRAVFMKVRPKAVKCQPGTFIIGSNITHEFCNPCTPGGFGREPPVRQQR